MTSLMFNRFHTVPTLFREFDGFFKDAELSRDTFTPAADIRETATGIELHLDVPGIKPEDIDVQVEGNVLTVKGTRKANTEENAEGWVRRERSFGTMSRSFTLADTLDGSKPTASYKNGVLMVTLPKKEVVLPKSVKVNIES